MNRRPRSSPKTQTSKPLAGRQLTEALIGGWRPLQRLDVAGFAVLRSRGITKRANSAVALDVPDDDAAISAAINRVEELYAVAGETPCFRVMSTHGPQGLDALLEARGYTIGGRSVILELPLKGRPTGSPHLTADIRVGPLEDDWFADAWRLVPREGDGAAETIRAILSATPAVQVRLPADETSDGEAVAVGRAALVETGRGSVAVLNAVAVDPEHRRRGLGRAVMQTLLAASAAQGVDRALLEVQADNAAATALYRGVGFQRLGEYQYRIGPS